MSPPSGIKKARRRSARSRADSTLCCCRRGSTGPPPESLMMARGYSRHPTGAIPSHAGRSVAGFSGAQIPEASRCAGRWPSMEACRMEPGRRGLATSPSRGAWGHRALPCARRRPWPASSPQSSSLLQGSPAAPPSGRRRARLGDRLGLGDLLACELRLEHRAQVAPVVALRTSPGSKSAARLGDHLARELELRLLAPRSRPPPPRSPPSSRRPRRRRASRAASASPCARIRQRFSLPQSDELADRRHAGLAASRVRSSTYGRRCASAPAGREVVRPVELDRVDVLERRRSGGSRSSCESSRALDRLEVGFLDEHELALRDLPALDELVRPDLAVVDAGTSASA